MSAITTAQLVRPLATTDTFIWTNNTGAAVVKNQLVAHSIGTNQAIALIAQENIAISGTGLVASKGVFLLAASAAAYTEGQVVQYATTAASVSYGGTASGTIAVGMCVEAAASAAGYIKCDLNVGPSAFYKW